MTTCARSEPRVITAVDRLQTHLSQHLSVSLYLTLSVSLPSPNLSESPPLTWSLPHSQSLCGSLTQQNKEEERRKGEEENEMGVHMGCAGEKKKKEKRKRKERMG
jgi:hypothetical protein